MRTFVPTHSIELTTSSGAVSTLEVSLGETTGPAYTKAEWEACAPASWEVDAEGVWTWRGRSGPDGVEFVEVRPIVVLRPRGEGGEAPLFACEVEAGGAWLANGTAAQAAVLEPVGGHVEGYRTYRLAEAEGAANYEAHDDSGGDWFFEPTEHEGHAGPYSVGYQTQEAALRAARVDAES